MLGIITGSSGFIGQNILNSVYFKKNYNFIKFNRNTIFDKEQSFTKCKFILHLAGKSHDLKNVSNFDLYYEANTLLTKNLYDKFLTSDSEVFIIISSVKAVADVVINELTEDSIPSPITHYGKSKLLAEEYILSKKIPIGKRVYILRPCMIHGPLNKGNLNLLYNFVSKGIPWPLGEFLNERSYCSIENFCFIIKELIERDDIQSGVYNISDDTTVSTNDVIRLISESKGKKAKIINISKKIITILARIGDYFNLPLNSERLQKLTESYIISNKKIIKALGKPLPISSRAGLLHTFNSFNKIT